MTAEHAKAQLEVLKATMELDGASDIATALDIGMKALDLCEVWSDGLVVAPKGTFNMIYNDTQNMDDDI